MNSWQQKRDIEEIIADGVRKVVADQVLGNRPDTAKTLATYAGQIATEVRERLQTQFSIRRPRKR